MSPKSKIKKCKECKASFVPVRTTQSVCSLECAIGNAKGVREKTTVRLERVARVELRIAKEKAKTLREWLAECQVWCNKYIRLRDAHLPCITCGTTKDVQYAAGHYRTRGAAGHLRFNEDNIHKQCNKHCNCELAGNIRAYIPALIAKIGQARFDAIENNNETHKWTIPEVQGLIAMFKGKIKELENGRRV